MALWNSWGFQITTPGIGNGTNNDLENGSLTNRSYDVGATAVYRPTAKFDDTNDDGAIYDTDTGDTQGPNAANEGIRFTETSTRFAINEVNIYQADYTYLSSSGTFETIRLLTGVFQLSNGQLFIAPYDEGTQIFPGGPTQPTFPSDFSSANIENVTFRNEVNDPNGGDYIGVGVGANFFPIVGDRDWVITGSVGDDVIDGTYLDEDAERIDSNDGSDGVSGGSGEADLILAYDGNDTVLSGDGNDTVYGGAGDDSITDSGGGNDIIDGGYGSDTIDGGAGNDTLIGDTVVPDIDPLPATDGWAVTRTTGGNSAPLIQDNRIVFSRGSGTGPETVEGTYSVSPGTQYTYTFNYREFGATAANYQSTHQILDANGNVLATVSEGINNAETGTLSLTFTAKTDTITIRHTVDYANGNTSSSGVDLTNFSLVSQDNAPDTNDTGDSIFGADGDDAIFGGVGQDTLDGGLGNDTIDGGTGNDSLSGGAGSDSMDGGAGDDTLVVGGGDVATGGDAQDIFILDPANMGPDGGSITIDGGTGAGSSTDFDALQLNGLSIVAGSYSASLDADGDSFSGSVRVTDGTNEWTVIFNEIEAPVCFTRGTWIETDDGEVRIEDLQVGDLVMTRDNGLQPIRWIGSRKIGWAQLAANPKLLPVRISAGALGNNTPEEDLMVSRQHRMLVTSVIVDRMLGEAEALIPAKDLVLLPGIDFAEDVTDVEYFHLLFDQHEVITANGSASESLYTGPEELKALSSEQREEILTILPELSDIDYESLACRPLIKGRMGRKMVMRHKQNRKPLVQTEAEYLPK